MYTLLIGAKDATLKAWLDARVDRGGAVVEAGRDHIAAMFVRGSDPPGLIVRVGAEGLGESPLLDIPLEAGIELPPTVVLTDGPGAAAIRVLSEPSIHAMDENIDEAGFHRFIDRLFAADDTTIGVRLGYGDPRPTVHLGHCVGDSPLMTRVYSTLERAGPRNAPVLITGESGTGKELAARALHDLSGRSGAFVPVNCGAIPETLIEDLLFGHVKGAFTGATTDKKGHFEDAHGGTLFLDEIGEMPMELQVRLLRVLEEGAVRRVGDSRDRKVDVRIVAATHVDLQLAVAEKRFRNDLYFRLRVLPLHLPPLRERGEDLSLLIRHIGPEVIKREQTGPFSLTRGAVRAMERYPWPGNVRELKNLLTHLAVLAESEVIRAEDLPPEMRSLADDDEDGVLLADGRVVLPEDGIDLQEFLDQIQKTLIEQARDRTGGKKARAADLLGLKRPTLIDRIKKLGVDWGS